MWRLPGNFARGKDKYRKCWQNLGCSYRNLFSKLSVAISILLKANHFLPKSLSEAPM